MNRRRLRRTRIRRFRTRSRNMVVMVGLLVMEDFGRRWWRIKDILRSNSFKSYTNPMELWRRRFGFIFMIRLVEMFWRGRWGRLILEMTKRTFCRSFGSNWDVNMRIGVLYLFKNSCRLAVICSTLQLLITYQNHSPNRSNTNHYQVSDVI